MLCPILSYLYASDIYKLNKTARHIINLKQFARNNRCNYLVEMARLLLSMLDGEFPLQALQPTEQFLLKFAMERNKFEA